MTHSSRMEQRAAALTLSDQTWHELQEALTLLRLSQPEAQNWPRPVQVDTLMVDASYWSTRFFQECSTHTGHPRQDNSDRRFLFLIDSATHLLEAVLLLDAATPQMPLTSIGPVSLTERVVRYVLAEFPPLFGLTQQRLTCALLARLCLRVDPGRYLQEKGEQAEQLAMAAVLGLCLIDPGQTQVVSRDERNGMVE